MDIRDVVPLPLDVILVSVVGSVISAWLDTGDLLDDEIVEVGLLELVDSSTAILLVDSRLE